jgi:hypothetical protein
MEVLVRGKWGSQQTLQGQTSTLNPSSSIASSNLGLRTQAPPCCSGASWSFLAVGLQTSPSGAGNLVAVPISGAGNLVPVPFSSLVHAFNPGWDYFVWLSRHSVFFQPNR